MEPGDAGNPIVLDSDSEEQSGDSESELSLDSDLESLEESLEDEDEEDEELAREEEEALQEWRADRRRFLRSARFFERAPAVWCRELEPWEKHVLPYHLRWMAAIQEGRVCQGWGPTRQNEVPLRQTLVATAELECLWTFLSGSPPRARGVPRVPQAEWDALVRCERRQRAKDAARITRGRGLRWPRLTYVPYLCVDTYRAFLTEGGVFVIYQRPEYEGYRRGPRMSVRSGPTKEKIQRWWRSPFDV